MDKLTSTVRNKILEKPSNTIVPRDEQKSFNVMKNPIPTTSFKLPTNFDGATIWKNFLSPVIDQGNCGSCWAFVSTSVLADRFNIQSLGLMNVNLSATKLILCDWDSENLEDDLGSEDELDYINVQDNIASLDQSACFGNTLAAAILYLYKMGTPTESCIPYTSKLGASQEFQDISSFTDVYDLPLCNNVSGPYMDLCDINNIIIDSEHTLAARFYKCINYYGIYGTNKFNPDGGQSQIQMEIYKWGPVASSIHVYADLYEFDAKNTIYKWNGQGPKVGGHAIEIVGWGEENGIPYWQIKNTWGTKWGNNGYFKMIRGSNDCGIEEHCISMLPDFFYPINYHSIPTLDLTILNLEKYENNLRGRNDLALNPYNKIAGGIDVTTGYSRRTMLQFPYLKLYPPIFLSQLPDWNKFMASNALDISNKYIEHNDNAEINILFIGTIILLCCGIIYYIIKNVSTNL